MTEFRDYDRWHDRYDDPQSDLSWRLSRVQQYIEQFLDQRDGRMQILSVCSGDGRDLFQVLAGRPDTGRITATLLKLHPALADRACATAAAVAPEAGVTVRVVDAGKSDAYVGAVPVDLVLLVGIMGNVSDRDVKALIGAAAGFTEVTYAALETGSRPALGLMRYRGDHPGDLVLGQRLFTFWR